MRCSASHLLRIEHDESLPSLPFLARLLGHYDMSNTEIADLVRSAAGPDGDPAAADDEGERGPALEAA